MMRLFVWCRRRWFVVVTLVLDPELDALLSQVAADLEVTREAVASVMLESALICSMTRS